MDANELWRAFCIDRGIDEQTPHSAWAFGGGSTVADELAELVVEGKKFGTASGYDAYVIENALDEIPKPGDYSVILKDNGKAVCVIRDYDVTIRKFGEVTPFHAYSEGEGDRSVAYWRKVHTEFFRDDLAASGVVFGDDTPIVCEKFCVEFIPGEQVTEQLIYTEPSMTFADEIMAYRDEMLAAGSEFDGCFSLKRASDAAEFVEQCLDWSNPSRGANASGTHGTVVLCIRKSDGRLVGFFQAHHGPCESMEKYTGHVGFSVRPSERGKGYAKMMLTKAADYLSCFGFSEIKLSCVPENEASRRVIIACGGEYIDTVYLEEDDVRLQRYRIRLEK